MRKGVALPKSFENLEFEEPEVIAKVSLELATPMIGGGAVAGAPDEHWPIRPTEIRGHLRFWWRAVEGYKYGKDMRAKEEDIFGGVSTKEPLRSAINLDVSDPKDFSYHTVKSRRADTRAANKVVPCYVIDLLMQQDGHPGLRLTTSGKFTVTVSRASGKKLSNGQTDSLRKAVWAWIRYGGLGARTRRGAGSLCQLKIISGSIVPAGDALNEIKSRVPTLALSKAWVCEWKRDNAREAWFDAINVYHSIRKGLPPSVYSERASGAKNDPTRYDIDQHWHSPWPDVESVRQIGSTSGQRDYPRALFGLPITFRLKGDPRDTSYELNYGDDGRFGSALIVKPIRSENGWKGMLLLLTAPGPMAGEMRIAHKCARGATTYKDLSLNFSTACQHLTDPNVWDEFADANALTKMDGDAHALRTFLTAYFAECRAAASENDPGYRPNLWRSQ